MIGLALDSNSGSPYICTDISKIKHRAMKSLECAIQNYDHLMTGLTTIAPGMPLVRYSVIGKLPSILATHICW